jgi:hypothetical protein
MTASVAPGGPVVTPDLAGGLGQWYANVARCNMHSSSPQTGGTARTTRRLPGADQLLDRAEVRPIRMEDT